MKNYKVLNYWELKQGNEEYIKYGKIRHKVEIEKPIFDEIDGFISNHDILKYPKIKLRKN